MGLNREQARKLLGRNVPPPTLPPQLAAVFGEKSTQGSGIVHTVGQPVAVERVKPHWEATAPAAKEKKPKKRRIEFEEQVRLVECLRSLASVEGADLVFSGSCNGVFMPPAVAGQAKGAGMERGDPDLVIWTTPPAHPTARGMMIEMKTPGAAPKTDRAGQFSGGRVEQKSRLAYFQALGWHVVIGYGCADALRKIRDAGYDVRGLAACLFESQVR